CSSADIDAPKTKSHRDGRWLFQGYCEPLADHKPIAGLDLSREEAEMTDWARSTIAKRVCGLRRSRRPNNKRKRISVHTGSPSKCDEPCRGWESWYGMRGCRLLALPQNPLVRRVGLFAEIVQSMYSC